MFDAGIDRRSLAFSASSFFVFEVLGRDRVETELPERRRLRKRMRVFARQSFPWARADVDSDYSPEAARARCRGERRSPDTPRAEH